MMNYYGLLECSTIVYIYNSSCVLELAEPLLGPDQLLTILPLIPFDTIMKVSRRRHHWHPATSIRNNILHQKQLLEV